MSNNNQSYEYRGAIRPAAVLTNDYVAGTIIEDVERHNQLMLFVDFTIGSLTNAKVKVEFSDNGEDYYQETYSSVSAGVSTESAGDHTFEATGKFTLAIPIKCSRIRVSAIGTGTVTSSSMKITAAIAVA